MRIWVDGQLLLDRLSDPISVDSENPTVGGASPQNQALRVEDDLVTFNLNGRTYTTTLLSGNQIATRATSCPCTPRG